MVSFTHLIVIVVGFIILAIASNQIGQLFTRFKLPLISGFLAAGILFGPYGLDFIHARDIGDLHFIDEISLAFIAFAAGSELYLQELKGRFKGIAGITSGLVLFTITLSTTAIFFVLSEFIPFMQPMPPAARLAVAILIGVILVARSPSSAIAIINEMRAKGPFTKTVMGVTVIMDVVVIFLFAFATSLAEVLLSNLGFDIGFVFLLLAELVLSLIIGYLLGKMIEFVLALHINRQYKAFIILAIGYGIFIFSDQLKHFTHDNLPFEIFLEPILLCMIGSFVVTNTSSNRSEFIKIIHDTGPYIYVVFFTLTGAALELDVLAQTWPIAVALFFIRLLGIFIGSFTGGTLAGEPPARNRMWWMAFVTQAGVAIGLAKEVATEFSPWGSAFATMIISLVVLNEIVGPIFFKWSINRMGEAHTRADPQEFDGVRDAIIFGFEDQAVALAKQLRAHDWHVKIACKQLNGQQPVLPDSPDIRICPVPEYTFETLQQLDASRAEAIVCLLSDEDNYLICELAYEHFGTRDLIVRLNNRANFSKFHELGVLIVDPATVMVGLLDHFVRSPSAASLLLGMDEGQDVVDVEVRNKDLDGLALRELRLPLDTLIMSVQRDGHAIISHGYTKLHLGDRITVVGSVDSLEEIFLRFDEQT